MSVPMTEKSDGHIQVGDLVQVVRGHVCDWGRIFVVASINVSEAGWHCPHCPTESYDSCEWVEDGIKEGIGADITWVRRIPPLSELEGERTDEQIKEPA